MDENAEPRGYLEHCGVYFVNGVKAAGNKWNSQIWDEFGQIVLCHEQNGDPFLIIGDLSAYIEISNGTALPSYSAKAADSKLNWKNLLQLSVDHLLAILSRHIWMRRNFFKNVRSSKKDGSLRIG